LQKRPKILSILLAEATPGCIPPAEYIGLNIIAKAKISIKFSLSPRNFKSSFHGIPQNLKQIFTGVNVSPCHSKEWTGKESNFEMQILFSSDLLHEWYIHNMHIRTCSQRYSMRTYHIQPIAFNLNY